MELNLMKISRHGEDASTIHIAIEADYGWQGEMCRDIIQINYHAKKREAFLTVKLTNPGAGRIAERFVEVITGDGCLARTVANPPLAILESLAERLCMRYSRDEAEAELAKL